MQQKTARGRDRRNRHVSRRFCHRARCAAYPTSGQSWRLLPVLLRTRRRRAVSDNISAFATRSGHQRLHKAVVPIPKSSPPFRIDRIGYPLKL